MANKQEMRYKLNPDVVAMGWEVGSLYHVTQYIDLRGNMPMNTAKEEVRKMLDQIPDDVSYEDIQYHIYVREKIERGLKDIEEGHLFSQEEVEERMSRWLGK